ncbi:DegT/DnrJ/EryC1/StrS family aminotransferase [Haloarchaeobius sp. HRN-SO-5]|uniref:DegT/DnrJ/EryC1/StrS family aminotransferase n=1 Tax=Haloarchaeobius sp. HRN-SO-5 TaxID=3446118 RepID=UPI003EB8800C
MIDLVDPTISKRSRERVDDLLVSGRLADGPEVRTFEDEFAEYCDVEHAVATSNGTTALHTALHATGIGEGDTVLVPPFTFVATANVVRMLGADPVFLDVDRTTYTLDADAVEAYLRETDGEADAVIPVHLFGLPADVSRLRDLGDAYDVTVVEDACQAHGAQVDDRPVGSIGDVGCFSFYPSKNMTTGEGGMLTTDDDDVAARARQFVNHGRDSAGYDHVDVGHNFRLTSIAAAIGREQLRQLPQFNRRRRANAAILTERLDDLPVRTPRTPSDRLHVFNQYTIRVDRRDQLADHLERADVQTGIYYPTPIHQQPAYESVSGSYPVSERLADEVLSLPVHPGLDDDEVKRVASEIRRFHRD